MILSAVILLTTVAQDIRADFRRASGKIKEGWTKSQVERALGKPDDVWPTNDDRRFVQAGDEVWCYGSNGHHTLPTLGRVTFRNGRVISWPRSLQNPHKALISIREQDIRKYLRLMHKDTKFFDSVDPLRLIQVSNALRPLGKAKALALLVEYSYIGDWRDTDWLFWVVRVLFNSKRPGGVFRLPALGAPTAEPPQDLRQWPKYPLLIIDDVPVSLWQGAMLAGYPEQFESYVDSESKNWSLEEKKLRPPSDPFSIYDRVRASSQHRSLTTWTMDQNPALTNILQLVRTAYPPAAQQASNDFKSHREAFLKLKCRWDETRQMYVRGDGSITEEILPIHPQIQYRFKSLPKIAVEVTLSRDEAELDYSVSIKEKGRLPLGNAVLIFIDPLTNEELHWVVLNSPKHTGDWQTTKDKVLSAPKHTPSQDDRSVGSGFSFTPKRKLKLRLLFEGKSYDSPIFDPK